MKEVNLMSNSYVIFAGNSQGNLQPISSAPTKKSAIADAEALQSKYPCVEAIYMPEDNLDINKIVYKYYKED
jgi:hypothetical protein